VTINGDVLSVPGANRLVRLQLRRFAGCPVCNLHLQSIVRRHDEIVAAGMREVVVVHSSAEELRPRAVPPAGRRPLRAAHRGPDRPDGRVMARKYGEHASDQWTVDELLAQAGSWPGAAARNLLVSAGRMG
jgi:hypothetical protein